MKKNYVVDDKVVSIGMDEFRQLKAIEAAFSANVMASREDAYAAFKKTARVGEMFTLAARRLQWQRQDRKAIEGMPAVQARALALYCNAAVTPLKRAFGEATLIAAMPDQAKDQHVIDVCRALGANDLAALCAKAKAAGPR